MAGSSPRLSPGAGSGVASAPARWNRRSAGRERSSVSAGGIATGTGRRGSSPRPFAREAGSRSTSREPTEVPAIDPLASAGDPALPSMPDMSFLAKLASSGLDGKTAQLGPQRLHLFLRRQAQPDLGEIVVALRSFVAVEQT